MPDKINSKPGNQSEWEGARKFAPGLQIHVLPGHMLSGCKATIMWVNEDVIGAGRLRIE